MYLKAAGVHGKTGLSAPLRWAFRDKKAGRRCIDAILDQPLEGIALAHGTPIPSNGNDILREGYTWLKA